MGVPLSVACSVRVYSSLVSRSSLPDPVVLISPANECGGGGGVLVNVFNMFNAIHTIRGG